jgi:hypothetical protein
MRIETRNASRSVMVGAAELQVEYNYYYQSQTHELQAESEIELLKVEGDVLELIDSYNTTAEIEYEIKEAIDRLIRNEHGF